MEKFGPKDEDTDNIDTSFMQRRQEALEAEGASPQPEVQPHTYSGVEANDIILEKLHQINTDAPQTLPILNLILDRVETLRRDDAPEEAIRADLDTFLSHHPALLVEMGRPKYNIADLPDANQDDFGTYRF